MQNFELENIVKFTKKYLEKRNKSTNLHQNKREIPLALPSYGWEEICEALDSFFAMKTTMGDKVKKFEGLFSKYIGTKYAIMVNSGSSANLLALSILSNPMLKKNRIRPGDEIITPAVTWATTVFPIVNVGAKPVFVDVDLKTYNLDPTKIESAITRKTRAIMPVHLLGHPCNMTVITRLASNYNLHIIEDSCEAHGAKINGRKVGSFGDIATFSFFASHHITTMEGGMIVTNNHEFYEIGKMLRAFGWIRDLAKKRMIAKKYPKIDSRFLFVNIGYNLRPTEIQGAFGIHQMRKLEKFIAIRIKNAEYWNKRLKIFSKYISLQYIEKGYRHVFFAYPITVLENQNFTKDELVLTLEKHGIETRPIMAGNFVQQPVIKYLKYKVKGSIKNSQFIMKNSFLIGNHQGIDEKKLKYVVEVISKFITKRIKN